MKLLNIFSIKMNNNNIYMYKNINKHKINKQHEIN